jgi:hypothetical protein
LHDGCASGTVLRMNGARAFFGIPGELERFVDDVFTA